MSGAGAEVMLPFTTLRLVKKREGLPPYVAAEWFCDGPRHLNMMRARVELGIAETEEPGDWRLQARGTHTDWHDTEEA